MDTVKAANLMSITKKWAFSPIKSCDPSVVKIHFIQMIKFCLLDHKKFLLKLDGTVDIVYPKLDLGAMTQRMQVTVPRSQLVDTKRANIWTILVWLESHDYDLIIL